MNLKRNKHTYLYCSVFTYLFIHLKYFLLGGLEAGGGAEFHRVFSQLRGPPRSGAMPALPGVNEKCQSLAKQHRYVPSPDVYPTNECRAWHSGTGAYAVL